jgi:hypothetical protein
MIRACRIEDSSARARCIVMSCFSRLQNEISFSYALKNTSCRYQADWNLAAGAHVQMTAQMNKRVIFPCWTTDFRTFYGSNIPNQLDDVYSPSWAIQCAQWSINEQSKTSLGWLWWWRFSRLGIIELSFSTQQLGVSIKGRFQIMGSVSVYHEEEEQ